MEKGYERFGGFLMEVYSGCISKKAVDDLVRENIVKGCILRVRFRGIKAMEYLEGEGYRIIDEAAFDSFFMDSKNYPSFLDIKTVDSKVDKSIGKPDL